MLEAFKSRGFENTELFRYEELTMPAEAFVSILKESFVKVAPSSLSHCIHAPSSVNANSDSMNLTGKLGRYLPKTNIEHGREKQNKNIRFREIAIRAKKDGKSLLKGIDIGGLRQAQIFAFEMKTMIKVRLNVVRVK